MFKDIRTAIGSKLVGLGFIIAHDTYWRAFAKGIAAQHIEKQREALADYDRELEAFASMSFSPDSEVSAQEMATQDLAMLRKKHGSLLSPKCNTEKDDD